VFISGISLLLGWSGANLSFPIVKDEKYVGFPRVAALIRD
jgi:hypothetical protein